ncbi:MAG: hypothetical protein Q4B60_00560 [Erysipelotrichaceae bacterium]|nr:hypothetical protein [Erysipelotrichaceae bacterium]
MHYYLPSCKIKSTFPDISNKIQDYLENKGVKVLSCCKLVNLNFNEEDIVLNNCVSCSIIMDERFPNVNQMSIYEYLLKQEDFKWPDLNGTKYVIQDCIRSNHKPNVQEAIRLCLNKMNIEVIESNDTNFDGAFKYKTIPPKTLDAAPVYYKNYQKQQTILTDEEIAAKMSEQLSEYPTDNIIVYCNSCYSGLKMVDENCKHILEIIFN